jgi:hypothetical protein
VQNSRIPSAVGSSISLGFNASAFLSSLPSWPIAVDVPIANTAIDSHASRGMNLVQKERWVLQVVLFANMIVDLHVTGSVRR